MSGLKVSPCSVVDATVSRPLLLRSSSSKALLCSCGLTLHGQLPIEIVPHSLFTRNPDKLYSFVHQLTDTVISQTHFSHKFGTYQSSGADSTCPNGGDWWTALVVNERLTDFAHIWSTLLRYEELFNISKLSDRSTLQQLITLCPSASDRTCDKSSCPCNGLQLRLGTVSTGLCPGPLSFWAPCSQVFAFQLVMAWAKLSMEEQERACPLETTNRPDSNLCRASYGVLENWVDLLTLGRLSALATNSVQIEPDAPSFLEESSCPLSPQSSKKRSNKELVIPKSDLCTGPDSLVDKPQLVTIVVRDSEAEGIEYGLFDSYPAPWSKLAHSWRVAVDKRIGQPGTLVVDLQHASQSVTLNTLVTDVMRSSLMFCTNT